MSNLLVNTRDQQFLLYEQLGIEKLFGFERYENYSKEIVSMIMSEAEKMAVEVIAPTLEEGDKVGAQFRDGKAYVPECLKTPYKLFSEAGWNCATKDPEVGGQNMPSCLYTACWELFSAANIAFTMYSTLTTGAAGLIQNFGTQELKDKYLPKMYAGEWSGTMCLTEPGAGSDVGALRTTAKRLPDGTFSITGTKCFISSGDHDLTENIVHPVLARIEGDPEGTKGISIFVVPKFRVKTDGSMGDFNDVNTGNLEHKMGIRASATATLNFGEDGNCVGELLGNEREGMMIMFQMMNEARLDVGVLAQSVASASYQHAVQYAKERIQSRSALNRKDKSAVAIIKHAPVRRNLMWMKAYLEGIRSLNYFTAFCIDMANASASEEEREKYQDYVELLTPICKAFSSDKGVEICSKSIDIYGGYGYCQEYPVEQYLRDCKITQIYEGTNQIQSLDLLGRKLSQNEGRNFSNLLYDIHATIRKTGEMEELKTAGMKLKEAVDALGCMPSIFQECFKNGKEVIPIQNAEPFLSIMGDVVCGWLLLHGAEIAKEKLDILYEASRPDTQEGKNALTDANPEFAFYQGKVASAKFFASEILPTVKVRCDIINEGEIIPMEIVDQSFTA
jgi:hypothetical protein